MKSKKPKKIPADVVQCKQAYESLGRSASSLNQKIADAIYKIEFVKKFYNPTKTILLSSGGNDSTLLLDLASSVADVVGHCNTGTGIEDTNVFMKNTDRRTLFRKRFF